MTKVAPIASAAGISIETTTAIMGTLTDAGIEASIAGTSLRNIFLKMQDPASDLTKKLGFTVNSSADLERALTKLNDEGLSNAEMMELVDLRQVAAFTTMINGTENVLSLTDSLEDANGEAQKMADIMGDTLEGDILRAKSAWEGLEIAFIGGSSNISKSLRVVISDWTEMISTVVDNMRNTEQLGADFLTNSLKNVKEFQNAGKAVQKINTQYNVTLKTRAELLQEEINKVEKTQDLQKQALAFNIEEGKGFGFRAKAARDFAEDLTKQIEAREFALNDLEEILEQEIKSEKNKNDRVQLEKDIAIEKGKRAKEKENKEKLKAKEKAAKEVLALEKQEFKESKDALKIALQEELNDEKQNLIDKEITQEDYNLIAFELEQAHLENMKNLNIAYGEDVAAINGTILDNDLKMIADKAAAAKEASDKEIKQREDSIKGMQDIGNQLILIAGEEESLQEIKKVGIRISQAAGVAAGFEAMQKASLARSEEHTSELQSQSTISYAVFCLKKKTKTKKKKKKTKTQKKTYTSTH